MSANKSNPRWLQRSKKDLYRRRAQQDGWRSRAVFKLQEIDRKYHLLNAGMQVLDLGAAPGGWSQYAVQRVAPQGGVVAVDILPMAKLTQVHTIQQDIFADAIVPAIADVLGQGSVDIVLSDGAPQMSGNPTIDMPRTIDLLERILEIAHQLLPAQGHCLLKAFHGAGLDDFLKTATQHFRLIKRIKPQASFAESREIYLLFSRL